MNQGEKLRKTLKMKDYTQKIILERSRFSKSKMYGIFKQNSISKSDQDDLIEDFGLPADFFSTDFSNTVAEPTEGYGNNWKEKYFELLEKYNRCLEDKEILKDQHKSNVALSSGHDTKQQKLKS